ncbi:AEC family transporter, partial [Candidatus Aerophobetes bacterium]|nr:AEC family transporter [Candidatus Aerophobetes bacterium]
MESPVVRAALPLLILIAAGFLSRKIGILKAGDERVLNAYTFYFALPALFLIDISTTKFDPQVQRFILVAIFPVIFVVVIFTFLYFIFKIEKSKIYLLILST